MQNVKQVKPKFNRRSTAQEVLSDVDLSGKTILITGVNSGLGLESMRALALRGAHVIGAARTMEKAAQACASVTGTTTPVACELSDFSSIAACADTVESLGIPIDALICNAGIMAPGKLILANGLEIQFMVNHLGHFLLVNRLIERIKEAREGRVVVVSSMSNNQVPKEGIDFDNLSGENGYDAWKCYGRSKLANLLFSRELAQRLKGSNATSNAVHPGVIKTNLQRTPEGFASAFYELISSVARRSIAQGAATQCYVAAHLDLAGVSGQYFANCNVMKLPKYGGDDALAGRLWRVSEELTAPYL